MCIHITHKYVGISQVKNIFVKKKPLFYNIYINRLLNINNNNNWKSKFNSTYILCKIIQLNIV